MVALSDIMLYPRTGKGVMKADSKPRFMVDGKVRVSLCTNCRCSVLY